MGAALGVVAVLPALLAAQTPTLTFSRTTVPGGYGVTLSLDLGVIAPKSGVTLRLTSGTPAVARFAATGTGSHSITIPGGQRTASVALQTLPVVADARVAITVATATLSTRKILAVQPLRPARVTFPQSAHFGGGGNGSRASVRVVLAEPAPKEGLRLQLLATSDLVPPLPFSVEAGRDSIELFFVKLEATQLTQTLVGVAHADLTLADARRLIQGAVPPVVANFYLYPLPTIVSMAPSGRMTTFDATVRVRISFAPAPVVSGIPVPLPFTFSVFIDETGSLAEPKNGHARYEYGQLEVVSAFPIPLRPGVQMRVSARTAARFVGSTFEFVDPAIRVVSIQPSRRTVTPGDSVEVTVQLERPVPVSPLELVVTTNRPDAFARPSRVTIPNGARTGKFMLIASQSASRTTVRVSTAEVSAGGVITGPSGEATIQPASSTMISADVEVVPAQAPVIAEVVPLPPTVRGGQPSMIEVRFTPVAAATDPVVLPTHALSFFSSDPSVATAEARIVNTRTTSIQVPITTTLQRIDTRVILTATLNGTQVAGPTATTSLLVTAPPLGVISVIAARTNLAPGDSVPVTVTIDRPAPESGVTIALRNTQPQAVAVPVSVIIPAGATAVTFFARVQPTVTVPTTASISTPAVPTPGGTSTNPLLTAMMASQPLQIVPLQIALPRVTALRAARTTMAPGDSVPITVTIDRAASGAGLTFLLKTSAPLALAVPSSVSIPAGASATTFFARAQPTVTATTSVSITTPTTPLPAGTGPVVDGTSNTVILGETVSSGPISIVPMRVTAVSLSPSPVFGGIGEVELTVRLSGAVTAAQNVALRVAQPANLTVSPPCPVPAILTVPAGTNEVRLRFRTAPVATTTSITCTVFAELPEVPFTVGSPNGALTMHPVPTIVDIAPFPTELTGGLPHAAQVRFVDANVRQILSGSAASIPLTITSNNPAVQGTTVSVPAGATEVRYSLPTPAVSVPTPVQLTYTLGGASTTRDFRLVPPPPILVAWTLNRSTVIGGDTVTGTVVIDRPASAPVEILFTTTSSTVLAPTRVAIPAGATQATVRIPTPRVTQGQSVTFTAFPASTTPVTLNDVRTGAVSPSRSATLAVEPLEVRQMLVDQPVGFGSVQRPSVTLILNAPAPSGGAKVVLTRSAPVIATVSGAALPLVLTVPGGADRITIALRTQQVQQLTDFTLSAFPAPEGSVDGPFTGVLDAASPLVRTIPMQLLPIPILTNLRVEPTTVVAGTAAVILGDLTNRVLPTLSTATPPTLSLVVNSDRPDIVASGTVVVRPGDTTVRLERPTTAITADATVRFTVTLVITRLSATLLVRHP